MKNKATVILAFLAIIIVSTTTAYAAGPRISLPTTQITIRISYPDLYSYYAVILSDLPSGHHVSNGRFTGWCADEHHNIRPGVDYRATMYSSYDPTCPHQTPNWSKVNYILNHKQGRPEDIQTAIWYFIDGGHPPYTAAAQALVNDADTNGQGFIPIIGETLAVVLWIDPDTQVAIIEIPVPIQNVVPEYPLGPVLGLITFIAALAIFKYRHELPRIPQHKHP
jgi:hypothetical protein